MIVAGVLAILCIVNVAWGANGAEMHSSCFHDPIRAESRPMGRFERVSIIDKTVEQEASFPGLNTEDVRFGELLECSVSMFAVGWDDKVCKDVVYSIGRTVIRCHYQATRYCQASWLRAGGAS